ncbi:hypothetical protein P3G55_20095, partial [Leptospira sp. 96542]|nr:hypothetical protein [Leptospira sp. 96542]
IQLELSEAEINCLVTILASQFRGAREAIQKEKGNLISPIAQSIFHNTKSIYQKLKNAVKEKEIG